MKQQTTHFVVALFVAALMGAPVIAQTIPDPEFTARPYSLSPDGTLKDLERVDASIDIKVKGGGYGGSETFYTAFSGKSPVRFSKATLPRIIIRVEGGVDPADLVVLSVAEVKKDRRRFLQGSMTLYGKARDVSASFIKVEFKKIRDGVYEVVLPADIAPGEYAIMPIADGKSTPAGTKISCFGID